MTLAGPAAAAALCAVTTSGCTGPSLTLICRHQRSEKLYAEVPVEEGTLIAHSWIHSIERSRWTETYRIESGGLVLRSSEFSQYGAGMPVDGGDVTHRDGKIVVENIDREFEAIRWFHSHQADYRIGVDEDETLLDAMTLPDREPLELRIES